MNIETQNRPNLTTPRAELLSGAQEAEWLAALERVAQHDFYHLPCYHSLSALRGDGSEHLFVYSEGDYLIALPMLLRAIDDTDGLSDATSVYGYVGPVASHARVPEPIVQRFQSALQGTLRERGVVALFSRLHPLIPHPELLAGLGEIRGGGQTVSIDLTLPQPQQRAAFRNGERSRIARLQRDGILCLRDGEGRHLREFCEIYLETMRRVGAREEYFFGPDYFTRLAAALGDRLQLFVALKDGGVIAGGLFTVCNGIVQYHLAGTRNAHIKLSPSCLILDTVRAWACAQGARVFHLGGGVGSSRDSLFCFKAGFSNRRHEFSTWRWVVDRLAYEALCERRATRNQVAASGDYFPLYRAPIVPADSDAATSTPRRLGDGLSRFVGGDHAKLLISTIIAGGFSCDPILEGESKKWRRHCRTFVHTAVSGPPNFIRVAYPPARDRDHGMLSTVRIPNWEKARVALPVVRDSALDNKAT